MIQTVRTKLGSPSALRPHPASISAPDAELWQGGHSRVGGGAAKSPRTLEPVMRGSFPARPHPGHVSRHVGAAPTVQPQHPSDAGRWALAADAGPLGRSVTPPQVPRPAFKCHLRLRPSPHSQTGPALPGHANGRAGGLLDAPCRSLSETHRFRCP